MNKKEEINATFIAKGSVAADWHSVFRSMDFWAAGPKEPKGIRLRPEIPLGLLKLADEVRYFSYKYESFFAEVQFISTERDEFNETKVRSIALERVLQEWDTVRTALEQRENTRYQEILLELDELSRECLSPLFSSETLEKGIYTYLHKLFDIKRFAFSHTPLIGVPFEALHSPESWLAIPHEAGHYIFWNGTETFDMFNKFYRNLQNDFLGAVERAVQGRLQGGFFHRKGQVFQTWLNWLDEIFADVFGTLVAGPAFAWSMQSNLRAHLSVRDLQHSHEAPEHPSPFIRPFFHIYSLLEMANTSEGDFASLLAAEAEKLENSWRRTWREDIEEDIVGRLPTPDNVGSMEAILDKEKGEVRLVVAAILDANLGGNSTDTLREYFKNNKLYDLKRHTEVLQFKRQIVNGERAKISSPLEKCIAAQLAIAEGIDPIKVHEALGYGGAENPPAQDESLDLQFKQFIENVTDGKGLEAWQRVLDYSVVEESFHWHTHPHPH